MRFLIAGGEKGDVSKRRPRERAGRLGWGVINLNG
jgi:hypothetical protein